MITIFKRERDGQYERSSYERASKLCIKLKNKKKWIVLKKKTFNRYDKLEKNIYILMEIFP